MATPWMPAIAHVGNGRDRIIVGFAGSAGT